MAQNKSVPLTWGIGGPVIGTAMLDENGIITAEIDDKFETPWDILNPIYEISIFSLEEKVDGADPLEPAPEEQFLEAYEGVDLITYADQNVEGPYGTPNV